MTTHEVLTASQRQQFQDIVHTLTQDDLIRYYTFSAADLRIIARRKRKTRFGFAIQLCYLRFPGRSLGEAERVPSELLLYVAQQIKLPTRWLRGYGEQRGETRDDHSQDLRKDFGYQEFSSAFEEELSAWLLTTALDIDDSLLLMTTLMEEMRQRQIIQPALLRLEALVWEVRERAWQMLFARLTGLLTQRQREQVMQLLEMRSEPPLVTHLVWLREAPREAKPINFNRLADRFEFIDAMNLPSEVGQAIPYHRLQQLAGQGERFKPQRLVDLADTQETLAILIAFLHSKRAALADQALRMNDELVRQMHNTSENQQQRKLRHNSRQINRIVYLHGEVGKAVLQARADNTDPYAAIERVLVWPDYTKSVEEAGQISQREDLDDLALVNQRYSGMRRYSPRLLDLFEVKAKSLKFLSPPQAAVHYGISPFGADFAEHSSPQAAGNVPAVDSMARRPAPVCATALS